MRLYPVTIHEKAELLSIDCIGAGCSNRSLAKFAGKTDSTVQDEYDSSKAQRGRFYRTDAKVVPRCILSLTF